MVYFTQITANQLVEAEPSVKAIDQSVCFISGVFLPSFNIPKDGLTYLGTEFPKCIKSLHPSIVVGPRGDRDQGYNRADDEAFFSNFSSSIQVPIVKNKFTDALSFYNGFKAVTRQASAGIDIAHIINVDPLIFSYLLKLDKSSRKTKKIFTIPMQYYGKRDLKDRLTSFLKLYAYSKFDGLCCTSPLLYDWLVNQNFSSVFWVPPPVDCDFFKPLTNESRPDDTTFTVLFFGDMNPLRFPARKVFKAIKILEQRQIKIKLLIISRYAVYHSLVQAIAEEERVAGVVKICIQSLTSNLEKRKIYNCADVAIFPLEGFVGIDPPVTLLEAMSCGRPVIVSNAQSMPRLVKSGVNGISLEIMTAERLADALECILTDKGKMKQLGINARMTVCRDFSKEKVAGKLVNMYQRILE